MKTMLITTIASIFLLGAWVSADRHVPAANLKLITSFDFSKYPACGSSASRYCIQAIRFYDPDSRTRLAEVLVGPGVAGPQTIVASVHLNSIPRHAYAVTVYRDDTGTAREGFPGQVSTFNDVAN